MRYIVIHYSEIGTKGKNRVFFEKKLIENIRNKIKIHGVLKDYGQFILAVEDFSEETKQQLMKTPGIANFLVSEKAEHELEDIKKKVLEILKKNKFSTFKIETARHHKQFFLNSMEVNQQMGEIVVKELGKKVKLKDPEVIVYVEICNKHAFIGTEKYAGLGGLPVGSAGKAVVLVSGGIDSPVAAYLMIRRGCEIVAVHFQNDTLAKEGVRDKVQQLCKKFAEYQSRVKLYIVPFGDLQREIIEKCPGEMRMLSYRYFMFKIAEEIALEEDALALVTGDNLSQVASQTLENLHALYGNVDALVLSPLIGFTKEEIITLAKKIETYEISILPYGDCCSYFVAEHPELRATREKLEKSLEGVDVKGLVEKALEKVEVEEF